MNFKQVSSPVLSVLRGPNQQWHVSAQDNLRQPLATFDNPQAACAWAIAHAQPKRGRVLVEELANSDAPSPNECMNTVDTFVFSIPVTWTEGRDSRYRSTHG